jgi:hypothetical protein
MNAHAVDVLELLREHYPFEVPAPSAELDARMDTGLGVVRSGDVPAPDESERRRRSGVVVFDAAGRRHRVRAVAAALAATLVLTTGLGVAGALPDALQRPFASTLDHLGIDVPGPDDARPAPRPSADDGTTSSTPLDATSNTAPVGEPATTGAPDAPTSSEPVPTSPPGSGAPGLPPAVLPSDALPPASLPAVTLPPVTLPPATLPGSGDDPGGDQGNHDPPPPPPVDLPLPPLPLGLA